MNDIKFYENYIEMLKRKNLKSSDIAKLLNISQAAITNWKNGAMPTIDKLATICEYLNVSADELLGINSKPKAGEPEQITEDGKRLLKYYMNCSVEGRAAIMKTAEAMESLNSSKETSSNSEILMNERNAV